MSRCPLCIIPARGGSRRLPRKNMAEIHGKTLIAWAAEAAVDSEVFDTVVVSSEDDEILAHAATLKGVTPLPRRAELATDTATVREVCADILVQRQQQEKHDGSFAILLAGNPLRDENMVRNAWRAFDEAGANALMSVVPFTHPPQRALHAPGGELAFYFDGDNGKRTQELDQLYRHDGSVFFAKSGVFLEHRQQYLPHTLPFYVDPMQSVDIDTPMDLAWAEWLMSRSSSQGARTP